MKNFFDPACQQGPFSQVEFGIRDEEGRAAWVELTDQGKWIATVENRRQLALMFTPVDKCIIHDHEEEGRGRCDGMLTTDEHLYFVELKEQIKGWMADAIDQLESTIQFFMESHDISSYRYKKAFACNRKHPHFHTITIEDKRRFFDKYGFRLDVQAKVLVI